MLYTAEAFRISAEVQVCDASGPTSPPRTAHLTTIMTSRHTSRLLLPPVNFLLQPSSRAAFPPHIRNASTPAKGLSEEFRRRQASKQQQPKPIPVIPQPDKFRPPSHSKRLPNRDLENKVYGPPLTEEDKKRMATKKYPNMMAPKGTFMHWFLHNRYIHVWISMVGPNSAF